MELASFTDAMIRRGCVANARSFCGSYNGVPFSVAFLNGRLGGATNFTIRIQYEGRIRPKDMLKQVNARTKPQIRARLVQSGNASAVQFAAATKNDDVFDAAFDSLLAAMVETGRQLGWLLPQNCPLCGAPGCESYAFLAGSYRPAHAECVRRLTATRQENAEKNKRQGSYLLGFVGAILGAFVGALPNILLVYLLNIYSGWLYFLVPVAAYGGYKLLRGKLTKVAIVFVIIASLLAVPFIYYFAMSTYYGRFLTLSRFILELRSSAGLDADFFVFSLLFTGFGILSSWGIISRTAMHEVQDASFSAQSLRPIQ